jgi:FOG: HEAT repeat
MLFGHDGFHLINRSLPATLPSYINRQIVMTIEKIFQDKSIRAKAKVSTIGEWLLNGELPLDELLVYAEKQKATDKATCIEAVEFATRKTPGIANESLLAFVTTALADDEPRVKWESAKVIGNIAALFPAGLERSVANLLTNAKNKGTVVRWAAAYALAEILKLKTSANKELLPEIEVLIGNEEDNGVKKKYLDALKKVKK